MERAGEGESKQWVSLVAGLSILRHLLKLPRSLGRYKSTPARLTAYQVRRQPDLSVEKTIDGLSEVLFATLQQVATLWASGKEDLKDKMNDVEYADFAQVRELHGLLRGSEKRDCDRDVCSIDLQVKWDGEGKRLQEVLESCKAVFPR
jgi:hypothetical protein